MLDTRTLTHAAIGTVAIGAGAAITAAGTVPVTFQVLGVFGALLILGGKAGTLSVALYLLLGAVGLPVFAGLQGGVSVFMGPTGGFLVGMLALALVYWAVTAWMEAPPLMGCLVGLLVCYLCGTAWYAVVCGVTPLEALLTCLFPFLLPDALKLAIAYILAYRMGTV